MDHAVVLLVITVTRILHLGVIALEVYGLRAGQETFWGCLRELSTSP